MRRYAKDQSLVICYLTFENCDLRDTTDFMSVVIQLRPSQRALGSPRASGARKQGYRSRVR